jgi:hypothetical protein
MKEKISHKITFQGFISTFGLILTITGIITLFAASYIILSILALFIGLVLFLSIRGVMIDYKSMRIKAFLDILIFKIGNWRDLSEFDTIGLRLFTASQTMNMVSISNTYTTTLFEVCLQGKKPCDLILKEFTDYSIAKTFLQKYSAKLKLTSIDSFALILEERNRINPKFT